MSSWVYGLLRCVQGAPGEKQTMSRLLPALRKEAEASKGPASSHPTSLTHGAGLPSSPTQIPSSSSHLACESEGAKSLAQKNYAFHLYKGFENIYCL